MADTNAFTSTFHYKVVEGSFKKDHYGRYGSFHGLTYKASSPPSLQRSRSK